jgi:hypothetical protein
MMAKRGEKIPCQICGSRSYYNNRGRCQGHDVRVSGYPCQVSFHYHPAIRKHSTSQAIEELIARPAMLGQRGDEYSESLRCGKTTDIAILHYAGCKKLMCRDCEISHSMSGCEHGRLLWVNLITPEKVTNREYCRIRVAVPEGEA